PGSQAWDAGESRRSGPCRRSVTAPRQRDAAGRAPGAAAAGRAAVVRDGLGTEALALLVHVVHELRAHDPVRAHHREPLLALRSAGSGTAVRNAGVSMRSAYPVGRGSPLGFGREPGSDRRRRGERRAPTGASRTRGDDGRPARPALTAGDTFAGRARG